MQLWLHTQVITMKAVVCTKYGPPEVLVLQEVEKPIPKEDEVLIQIHATSITASDVLIRAMDQNFFLRCVLQAIFGFGKPRNPILGMTLSGVVQSTGKNVTLFEQGDKVFAYGSMSSATNMRFGSYAEYICLPEHWNLLAKPVNITHKQAAAVPYGGFLAWHVVKKGNIQRGQKVLLYGASGSIGTMAIQLAKDAGANLTAVCSSKNFELVKSLGADHVIDYTSNDAVSQLERYDLVLDTVGNSKTSPLKTASKTALTAGGKYISVDDELPSTMREDFVKLKELVEQGKLVPVIDRCFPLEEMAKAHAYVDQGHKKGNVVISVADDADQL